LIVEEDYQASLDYSLTLQGAGMTTTVVHDPSKLWEALVEERPDLIMVSLSLAGINGFHLAAVIRQQDAYMDIPIILLSTESGLARQVEAMRVEADDVLVTPVSSDVLISSVANQVQRARALNRFVSTDNLTGLLSHSAFLARLVLEVDRAVAANSQLAFAVVDIDHLHAINETYGHLSGDSALTTLARLLKQRLRRSDELGRYGGDEIAIVMPATSGQNSVKVLDGIRGLYAEIREYASNAAYFPTFSCGVAALPGYEDCSALRQAALDALDSARRQGRNRVVLAAS
jgi:diguanylate cyclase (GGDEF)-like protein